MTRERSNVCISPRNPWPSSPSRRSSPTRTSSRNSSVLTMARWPIFLIGCPTVSPPSSRSTTNAVIPRWPLPGPPSRRPRRSPPPRHSRSTLLAAQDVAAVDAPRGRLDRRGVGARPRLRGCERGERRVVARQWLDPAPLLRLVAERKHRLGEEAVRRDQVPDARAAVRELLLHDAAGQAIGHPATAELLRQHERGQADLGRLVPSSRGTSTSASSTARDTGLISRAAKSRQTRWMSRCSGVISNGARGEAMAGVMAWRR